MTIFKGSVLLNCVKKKEKENLRQEVKKLNMLKQSVCTCVCVRVHVCERVHVHFLTSCQKLINVDFSVVEN